MDKATFIREGKKRGIPKEELRRKFMALDAAGKFDDSSAKPIEEEKKPLTEMFKGPHKIPEFVKGVGKRVFEDRPARIDKPTMAGELAQKIPVFGGPVSKIAEMPEKAFRTVAGIAGTIGEPSGVAVELGFKGIDKLSGGRIGKFAKEKIGGLMEKEPVQKTMEAYQKLPESAKANIESTLDFADIAGVKGTRVLKKPATEAIQRGLVKGIGFKTIGPKTWGKNLGYVGSGEKAVDAIVEHRKNIKIFDKDNILINRPPETAAEFSQALREAKAIVYQKYHNIAMRAGEDASFSAHPIVKKLTQMTEGKKSLNYTPEEISRLQELIVQVAKLDGVSPDILETRIKKLNYSFPKIQKGGKDRLVAEIDLLVATEIRKQLDEKIKNATLEAYQPLRDQYKALSDIEDKVTQEAQKRMRRAGMVIPGISDVFLTREFIGGLLSASPQLMAMGATGKGLLWWMRRAFDPERKISNMFKQAYDVAEKPWKKKLGIGAIEGVSVTPKVKGAIRGLGPSEEEMRMNKGRPALPMR